MDATLVAEVVVGVGIVFVIIKAVLPNGQTVNLDTKDFSTKQEADTYAKMANKGMNK